MWARIRKKGFIVKKSKQNWALSLLGHRMGHGILGHSKKGQGPAYGYKMIWILHTLKMVLFDYLFYFIHTKSSKENPSKEKYNRLFHNVVSLDVDRGLHSVSLLQAMRWIEYASPTCCSSQLWLNRIPQPWLMHIWIRSLYGLLLHNSPAVVFFDVGIQASGI